MLNAGPFFVTEGAPLYARLSRCRQEETPPRMWGRPMGLFFSPERLGNTPTCVGKTNPASTSRRPQRKHPHACGEDTLNLLTFSALLYNIQISKLSLSLAPMHSTLSYQYKEPVFKKLMGTYFIQAVPCACQTGVVSLSRCTSCRTL